MKKNNKGFALAETLIVSTVVASVLIVMFIQFASVRRNYNNSYKYNTVNGLYAIEDINSYFNTLSQDTKKNYLKSTIDNVGFVYIYEEEGQYNDNVEDYESIFNEGLEDNYAINLLTTLNVSELIITPENIKDIDSSNFSVGVQKFIKKLKYNENTNNHRMIVKFKDGTYANLVFNLGVSIGE